MTTLPSPHPQRPMLYPAWATTDARVLELAEWLHNRDHQQDTHHRWAHAPVDERIVYCSEARHALRFIDSAPAR